MLSEERLCSSCSLEWFAPWALERVSCAHLTRWEYRRNSRSQDRSKKGKKTKASDYKHIIGPRQHPLPGYKRKKERVTESEDLWKTKLCFEESCI